MNSRTGTAIENVTEGTCWELLGTEQIGRLAVTAEDGVDIYPIDYVVASKVLYFRSAPGRKLINLTADPVVAFEADGTFDRRRWSVVVRGTARRMDLDSEIEASGVNQLKSHSPTTKWNYVQITPRTITGRRFFTR